MKRVIIGSLALALLLGACGTKKPSPPKIATQPGHLVSNGGRLKAVSAPYVGEWLVALNGTWAGTPASYAYAWQDCDSSGNNCVTASGSPANQKVYTVVSGDVGHTIRVTITVTGASPTSQTSAASGVVAGGPGSPVTPTLTASAPGTDTTGAAIAASSISGVVASGKNPTGTITFKVFGPQTSAPTTCTSGGTTVGTATITGNGTYHPSAGYTPASSGNYWWYLSYAGDTNNNAATSTCGSSMPETIAS